MTKQELESQMIQTTIEIKKLTKEIAEATKVRDAIATKRNSLEVTLTRLQKEYRLLTKQPIPVPAAL